MNNVFFRFLKRFVIYGVLLSPLTALALEYQYESYVGVHGLNLTYSEGSVPQDYQLSAVYGRFGARFDDWYAIEWRVGRGIGSDELIDNDEVRELSQGMFYGAYFLVGYTWRALFPYLLVGASQMEVDLSGNGSVDIELETSGVSYGAGLDIEISRHIGANIEYTRYAVRNDIELGGLSAGISYLF